VQTVVNCGVLKGGPETRRSLCAKDCLIDRVHEGADAYRPFHVRPFRRDCDPLGWQHVDKPQKQRSKTIGVEANPPVTSTLHGDVAAR
jgi:hypothetical protein